MSCLGLTSYPSKTELSSWRMSPAPFRSRRRAGGQPDGGVADVTPLGWRVAVLFTKTYGRVLAPGLAALTRRDLRAQPLDTVWRRLDRPRSIINDGLAII